MKRLVIIMVLLGITLAACLAEGVELEGATNHNPQSIPEKSILIVHPRDEDKMKTAELPNEYKIHYAECRYPENTWKAIRNIGYVGDEWTIVHFSQDLPVCSRKEICHDAISDYLFVVEPEYWEALEEEYACTEIVPEQVG